MMTKIKQAEYMIVLYLDVAIGKNFSGMPEKDFQELVDATPKRTPEENKAYIEGLRAALRIVRGVQSGGLNLERKKKESE